MQLELAVDVSTVSLHFRITARETVMDALFHLGAARGSPAPVWPPRKLPGAPWAWIFVSPVRNGWVSVWGPPGSLREWFPHLAATLESPSLLLEVIESRFWIAELRRGEALLGRIELPSEAVAIDLLRTRAVETLEADGVVDPWMDEERLAVRMETLAEAEEIHEELRELAAQRPAREALLPFLPPHASLDRAWELLTSIDRHASDPESDPGASPYAEDYMEAFASYLLIRDPAWDPGEDAEALAEGDTVDEEGFPEGWKEFVVVPVAALPVLDSHGDVAG